jgi:hypothetical protein
MPRVRIGAGVLATIAGFVATPSRVEYAFELDFEPRDADYYVERVLSRVAGTKSSAPTPRVAASAHTHHIENYRDQQCHVGWPSGDDMRWIFGVALERRSVVVHLCAAVEGTYIVACDLQGAPLDHANGEDIFRYFSSAHGHRCAPGHGDEDYPSADAFIRLAHAFRFTGPLCERHAGEGPVCARAARHRARAAKRLGDAQVFFARFVPHDLAPRTTAAPRTYYGVDARAHLANINDGHYDHAGTITVPPTDGYVDLDVPAPRRSIV